MLAAAADAIMAAGIGVVAFLTTPAAPKPANALLIKLAAAGGLTTAAAGGVAAAGAGAAAAIVAESRNHKLII